MHGTSTLKPLRVVSNFRRMAEADKTSINWRFLSGNGSGLNWRTNPQWIPVNVPRERKAMGQRDVDDGVDRG